jgi:hypothetical protein
MRLLLGNAIHYSQPGAGSMTHIRRVLTNRNTYCICIMDYKVGIKQLIIHIKIMGILPP